MTRVIGWGLLATLLGAYLVHILTAGLPDTGPAPEAPTTARLVETKRVGPNAGLTEVDPAPAPTTVDGYRKMFRAIDPKFWGAADVSISVKIDRGMRVWLYGDTFSEQGMVHSTAIVQKGGNLHVANGGAQILPNGAETSDGRSLIYWIERARARDDGKVVVTAAQVSIGTDGPWDFRRAKDQSRQALLRITDDGDVRFMEWVRWVDRPLLTSDGEDFTALGPHHFSYAQVIHDIRLEDGSWLKTTCQNWDDPLENHVIDGVFQWGDFRPMWSSSPTRNLDIEPWPNTTA